MNARFASAIAAVVLAASGASSSALAQSYTAPAGISAAAAPGKADRFGGGYDDVTTGSVGPRRSDDPAKDGNAEQNSFPVWQYGRTSGGTAR